MNDWRLGAVEMRFAELIWRSEPLPSGTLVKLCEKGIFRNENGLVSSLISREEFRARQSEQFVSETYGGSLPAFIAAFTARRGLTADEASESQKLIDDARREG